MSAILLRGGDLVTLDDEGSILRRTDLLVRDGRIAAIGEAATTDPEVAAALERGTAGEELEVVDVQSTLVLPGLVNAHCHSPMTLQRGAAEDMPFSRWLPEIWRIEKNLEPEDIYWGAALAAVEMIRSGVVAFNCMYFRMEQVAAVVRASGMRAALGETVFDPGAGTEAGDVLERAVQWTASIASDTEDPEDSEDPAAQRLRVFLAPHSPYACSRPLLEKVVEEAHALGVGVHLHVSEDQRQVDESRRRYGTTPVQLLESIGVFEVPGGCVAAHSLVLEPRDVEILALRGVHVPHCSITYAKLAMETFPLQPLIDAGVRLCLGTDGPASNADMDLFAVIRHTALMQKYMARDPTVLSGDTLLRLATRGGAEALGFADAGVLRVGALADLIVLDADAPHLQPAHSPIANLVHSVKGSDVVHSMVGGEWLMREREVLTLDEAEIVFEAARRGAALLERAAGERPA